MKRVLAWLLVLTLLLPLGGRASAEEQRPRRAVIGADLTAEQIEEVYRAFGVSRGTVTELKVSNQEERQYLEGLIEESVIGTRSISCVYVELREEGGGMSVSTNNISWCTADMYVNALTTAGITDAKIIVAAPFSVSGTAALTGIYKAYEDMTGETLTDEAKQTGTQELTLTGELAEEIGSEDSTAIINDLKEILEETAAMSDEELHERIEQIAAGYDVTLTENQVRQLIDLCRSLEKLNVGGVISRVEQVQETIQKVSDAKDKVVSFVDKARSFFNAVADFFNQIKSIFGT